MIRRYLITTAVAGLFLAGCETPQQRVGAKEDHLLAAGFFQEPANTAARHAMLMQLPAHRFIRRVHGDDVRYVFADPTVCGCLYVGSQQAYGRYQQYRQQQSIANEQQETAMEYQNPSWNWGPWGPGVGYGYGPGFGGGFGGGFGPGFAYGPGFGW